MFDFSVLLKLFSSSIFVFFVQVVQDIMEYQVVAVFVLRLERLRTMN
jgi:hypothetical protein